MALFVSPPAARSSRAGIRIGVPSVAFTYDKAALMKTMRAAGQEVAGDARRMLRAKQGAGRLYYGAGGSAAKYRGGAAKFRYRASAPGAPPVRVTGTLAKSIRVFPFRKKDGVAVRDTAFYGLFLESGAKGGAGGSRGGPKSLRRNKRTKRGVIVRLASQRVLEPRPYLTKALAGRNGSLQPRIAAAAASGIAMKRLK